VIERCRRAKKWLETDKKLDLDCKVVVLCPEGDEIAGKYRKKVEIFEGPEDDVLERYVLCAEKYMPDYIVRITGDCPMIPEYIITKHIRQIVYERQDYVTNVMPDFRTEIDGVDCEALSARLLTFIGENAKTPHDREHVTTWLNYNMPRWARVSAVCGFFDMSHVKLSVDTEEDYKAVCEQYERVEGKVRAAQMMNYKVVRL